MSKYNIERKLNNKLRRSVYPPPYCCVNRLALLIYSSTTASLSEITNIVPLDMRGCIWHFVKCHINPFVTKWTIYNILTIEDTY